MDFGKYRSDVQRLKPGIETLPLRLMCQLAELHVDAQRDPPPNRSLSCKSPLEIDRWSLPHSKNGMGVIMLRCRAPAGLRRPLIRDLAEC